MLADPRRRNGVWIPKASDRWPDTKVKTELPPIATFALIAKPAVWFLFLTVEEINDMTAGYVVNRARPSKANAGIMTVRLVPNASMKAVTVIIANAARMVLHRPSHAIVLPYMSAAIVPALIQQPRTIPVDDIGSPSLWWRWLGE